MTSYAVRTRSPVTSRAAVVYAHKNETIDVITSKDEHFRKKILSDFSGLKSLLAVGYLIYFYHIVFKFGARGGAVG